MVRRTFLGGSGVRSVFMLSMATMAVDVNDDNNVVAIKIRGKDGSETARPGAFAKWLCATTTEPASVSE